MPNVNKGESEKHYVSRAIRVIMREHPGMKADQAAAIAHSLWDKSKHRRKGR